MVIDSVWGLGSRLRSYRLRRGLTLRAVALLLDVNPRELERFEVEAGKGPYTSSQLEELLHALGASNMPDVAEVRAAQGWIQHETFLYDAVRAEASAAFTKLLLEYRRRSGLTIDRTAELMGVTPRRVAEWEKVTWLPTPAHVLRLAHLYGLTEYQHSELQALLGTALDTDARGASLVPFDERENQDLFVDTDSAELDGWDDDLNRPSDHLGVTQDQERVPSVFISYRRSDQAALAGRLYDRLTEKFGRGRVFMDVDSIELGLDFVEVLEKTLSHCDALIVVIGKSWLNARSSYRKRRIDNPNDFVRLEIEMALKRKIRVIPVLAGDASMPNAGELPESIRPLARRSGCEISNARFGSDCLELISTLERILDA